MVRAGPSFPLPFQRYRPVVELRANLPLLAWMVAVPSWHSGPWFTRVMIYGPSSTCPPAHAVQNAETFLLGDGNESLELKAPMQCVAKKHPACIHSTYDIRHL